MGHHVAVVRPLVEKVPIDVDGVGFGEVAADEQGDLADLGLQGRIEPIVVQPVDGCEKVVVHVERDSERETEREDRLNYRVGPGCRCRP